MSNINQLTNLLKYHLSLKNLYSEDKLWKVQESPVEGRGIFAIRDINPGEIIFIDHPLLIGPRAGTNYIFHCVICCKLNNIHACTKRCGLPVCSQCEQNPEHLKDCDLIHKLHSNGKILTGMSPQLFRSLTPLRSLLLNENSRDLLKCLACHSGKIHGFEIDLIKQYLTLKEADEQFMKTVCSVLDSNAFETVMKIDNTQISVRGLYPLSAIMNHSCCPNTTNLFNNHQQMIVKATVLIPKDNEIFTTYTNLLWGTSLRRHTQHVIKHFWCQCGRCKDPKEFGSCVNGLKCMSENCEGIIYPVDPIQNCGKWKCDICEALISSRKVGIMQSIFGVMLRNVNVTEVDQLIILIRERLYKIVPSKNHIAYELKMKAIWALGHNERYSWSDLTMDQLKFKEQLCNDVLEVLQELKLGLCKMRGLLLYELYRTRLEKCLKITNDSKIIQIVKEENKLLLKEASEILENDVTAPAELTDFVNC